MRLHILFIIIELANLQETVPILNILKLFLSCRNVHWYFRSCFVLLAKMNEMNKMRNK